MGTHCAPRNSGASDLSGLMETNSMPASFARRSHVSMVWAPAPPEVTWPFLVASPPHRTPRGVVSDERRPAGDRPPPGLEGANPPRRDVLRRAEAVIGALAHAAAAEEQNPPQQAAGMVHAACRRPAIGAAEDRGMA